MEFSSLVALQQERDEAQVQVTASEQAIAEAKEKRAEAKARVQKLNKAISALNKPAKSGRTRVSSEDAKVRVQDALQEASGPQSVADLVKTTGLNTPAVTKALMALGDSIVETTGKKRGMKFTTVEKMKAAMDKFVEVVKDKAAEAEATSAALSGTAGATDHTGFGADAVEDGGMVFDLDTADDDLIS